MAPHFLLLAGVFGAKADADLPPPPDFSSLIPQICAYLPASERHKYEPTLREAVLLAKYLTRAWSGAKSPDEFTRCAEN